MRQEFVIGTRESELALYQAEVVRRKLSKLYPHHVFRIVGMKTKGDKIQDVALAKIGDKGLFTKELEIALLQGKIDMAVHSMKDLPTYLPPGLVIGAVCEREYPGDVLISRHGLPLDKLPSGARVGTSSLRRGAQLRRFRPDLEIVPLRGNLNTRLRKLYELSLDGIVLAYAGVHRMGWDDKITQLIPYSVCLPAVGQGAIGIEVRGDDPEVMSLVEKLDHFESRAAVEAERAMMRKLEGGCQVPIGALGTVRDGKLVLEGMVASLDGSRSVRHAITGEAVRSAEIGARLAEVLFEMGAGEILSQARREFEKRDAKG